MDIFVLSFLEVSSNRKGTTPVFLLRSLGILKTSILKNSTAFNIFVRQTLREGRIPFDISINNPNKKTVAAMIEAERIARDTNIPGYTDVDMLLTDLKND